ncbi:MAG: GNAT family N-acetyltransferase [Bryobacteraceae bacterium]
MNIRPAAPEDLDAIGAIEGPSVWRPADYLSYDCRVAVENGRVMGFLVTREVAAGEREVLNLVVDSSFRRRGIAAGLLKNELDGWPGDWFLEVRESNLEAMRLYKSLGFQAVGRREEYYSNPIEAAIVMRLFS